jgi:hypothetical protein
MAGSFVYRDTLIIGLSVIVRQLSTTVFISFTVKVTSLPLIIVRASVTDPYITIHPTLVQKVVVCFMVIIQCRILVLFLLMHSSAKRNPSSVRQFCLFVFRQHGERAFIYWRTRMIA